jgi:hypothetical protein
MKQDINFSRNYVNEQDKIKKFTDVNSISTHSIVL